MVDVGAKAETARSAVASGDITMKRTTLAAIVANSMKKGDVLGVARIAGIMAGKKTSDLIPLCHPIPLTEIAVTLVPVEDLPGIRVQSVAKTVGKTGVEMEALTAVTVALLTIYDMAKAVDRSMVIGNVQLENKTGGASGAYTRR